jgi:hypothetical protein
VAHPGPLAPLPAAFAGTSLALHRLAVYVVSPARRHATGNEIALEPTPGGFGTPSGAVWGQVRVDGEELVVRRGDDPERRAPITTLRAAAAFAGIVPDVAAAEQFDVPAPGDLDEQLAIDGASVAALAAFYAVSAGALALLRDELDDASPVRLWPEHFDVAIDAGSEARARRGTWGASPGDAAHPAPYLYVSVWSGAPDDPFFGETAFPGASLPYDELVRAPDAGTRALEFWRAANTRLN